ncbi:helix-turn-helix domain-containing protein [Fusobacterium polymorphum]|uniref:helix-turn-helix domain-containing protein n=1 Tax=Fusobacterium nucleatum subsp. polymorphum TaxID=76857 RepID=UPI0030088926
MADLSITLKKLREKKGITQQELVKISGVGQGTIGDIERGKIKKSRLETLEKIAKALKLDEEEREELFSVLVPKDISVKILKNPLYKELDSRGRMQFKEIVEQSSLMFNDENISEEDKQKVLLAIQDAFYDAKQKNKKKK